MNGTRKMLPYTKNASTVLKVMTASCITPLTHEMTMNERFNMIGLIICSFFFPFTGKMLPP